MQGVQPLRAPGAPLLHGQGVQLLHVPCALLLHVQGVQPLHVPVFQLLPLLPARLRPLRPPLRQLSRRLPSPPVHAPVSRLPRGQGVQPPRVPGAPLLRGQALRLLLLRLFPQPRAPLPHVPDALPLLLRRALRPLLRPLRLLFFPPLHAQVFPLLLWPPFQPPPFQLLRAPPSQPRALFSPRRRGGHSSLRRRSLRPPRPPRLRPCLLWPFYPHRRSLRQQQLRHRLLPRSRRRST